MSTRMDHFREVLGHFDTTMLITQAVDAPRARPMAIADREFDGTLWLATSQDTSKTDEIRRDHAVCCVMQSSNRYLSLSGTAQLVNDLDKKRQLWSKAWETWFPDGPEDPDLVLIKVEVERGEYWDLSGFKGIKAAYEMIRSIAADERPTHDEPDTHGVVHMS